MVETSASPGRDSVRLESLSRRFGDRTALDSVSASFPSTRLCAVLGPNGCGKTTLFRILATALRPDDGTAVVLGHDVVDEPDAVRRAIGVVFQSAGLDPLLTVRENLQCHARMYGIATAPMRKAVDRALSRFDLTERAGDRVATLSGGFQRRVEIAKAMLHAPRLLLLDEPSAGLDPAARAALMASLANLRDEEGVTSLLTTHIMEDAEACDEVAIMSEGRILAIDTPLNLTAKVGGDVVTAVVHDPEACASDVRQRFNVDAAVIDGGIRMEIEDGHRFVPDLIEAFSGRIERVSVGRPTISDAYLDMTGRALGDDEA